MSDVLAITPPHQWTHDGSRVLMLKCVDKNRQSHGGFQWPESGAVTCPDWIANNECGNGLHGWPWGLAFGDGRDPDYQSVWLVLAVDPANIIDLGGKAKCSECEVIECGTYLECLLRVLPGQIAWTQHASSAAATSTGGRGAATSTGGRGAATSTGDSAAATSTGGRGAATSTGDSGAATSTGDSAAATSTGWRAAATSTGWRGAATSTGGRGAATSTGGSGAATSTGWRGAATSTGWRGAATSTGLRGAATSTGGRSIAAVTGDHSAVECGPTDIAVATPDSVIWVAHPGAVLCQRTERGVWLLIADEWDVADGERLLVEHGVIWQDWE